MIALFRFAINIVFRHKLRTFLTSLGITISVILLTFIIFGMQSLGDLFTDEFTSRFDPNQVIVSQIAFPFAEAETVDESEEIEAVILNEEVVQDIENEKEVDVVDRSTIITGMKITLEGEAQSYEPAFFSGIDLKADDNLFVGYVGDLERENGEAYLSKTVVDSYGMDEEDVLGKTVTVEPSGGSIFNSKTKSQLDNSFTFEIVAVVDPGADQNDLVLRLDDSLDLLATNGGFENKDEYLDAIGYDQLLITANEGDVEELKIVLKEDYGLEALTAEDFLEFLDLITVGITVVLVLFAIVSSIVASIGIINTMVMSIYEQTKEIGLNKAIGASNLQIMIIYLIQSGAIGFLGSVFGLIIVFAGMMISDGFIVTELEGIGFTTEQFFNFDFAIAAIIVLSSILVGILAGLYPALMAARLDPVKALRYD